MAVMVALCTACDKSNEPSQNDPDAPTNTGIKYVKKILEKGTVNVKGQLYPYTNSFLYKYNSDGTLKERQYILEGEDIYEDGDIDGKYHITESYVRTDATHLVIKSIRDGKATVDSLSEGSTNGEEIFTHTYCTLDGQGRVINTRQWCKFDERSSYDTTTSTYNADGYLVKYSYFEHEAEPWTTNYIWNLSGNLVEKRTDSYSMNYYSYGQYENKSNLLLAGSIYRYGYVDDEYQGKISYNLPSKDTTYIYTYEFDNEGCAVKITIKDSITNRATVCEVEYY